MRIGITLPQYELDPGREPVEAFIGAAERSGFAHVAIYDHVLGVDLGRRPDFRGPYNATHQFHEPMVLMGFIAAISRLELATSVVVLPQRSAALVAKQAAEIDVLSGGRLRLGVGIGWNRREFAALGERWDNRGARMEEQIQLMRQLWIDDAVDFTGRFHRVDGLGIRPTPVQRPIPVWLGGGLGASDLTFRRIGRVADGWMPNLEIGRDDEQIARGLAVIREASQAAGRAPDAVRLEGLVQIPANVDLARVRTQIDGWWELGATHITLRTLDEGRTSDEHVDVVIAIARSLGVQNGRVAVTTTDGPANAETPRA